MLFITSRCTLNKKAVKGNDIMSTKKVSVANFNTVFLCNDEEHPLLEYFDTILMPALNSNIIRTIGDDKYFFMNAHVVMDNESNYILTGLIIKRTVLEIKSDINEYGELIALDNKYPSAPFSIFTIFLKNHRMIYVENQKGSPKLDSFRSTIKYVIDKYVREKNATFNENSQEKLPIPLVNVVGIPPRKNIERELKEVSKISSLTLRFYPLNGDGDIDFVGVLKGLSKDFRRVVGSNNGEITYKSPKNIQGVIDMLSKTEGTVEPILRVEYENKSKRTIRTDEMTETMELNISGENFDDVMHNILIEGKKIESLNYTSEENKKIYERNIGKIIPFRRSNP